MVDKDRIQGSAEQAKGKVKEVVGKVTGDSKLEGEGRADQLKGKVQNTVGGLKDTLRGKWSHIAVRCNYSTSREQVVWRSEFHGRWRCRLSPHLDVQSEFRRAVRKSQRLQLLRLVRRWCRRCSSCLLQFSWNEQVQSMPWATSIHRRSRGWNYSCDATLVWLGGPRPLPPQPDRLAENPGS